VLGAALTRLCQHEHKHYSCWPWPLLMITAALSPNLPCC
jgi:hypothetical protein